MNRGKTVRILMLGMMLVMNSIVLVILVSALIREHITEREAMTVESGVTARGSWEEPLVRGAVDQSSKPDETSWEDTAERGPGAASVTENDEIGDGAEKILKCEKTYEDGVLSSVIEYDIRGNEVNWNLYNQDGDLYRYHIYDYDSKGNMISEERYIYGNLEGRFICEYDDYGNKVMEVWYDEHGNMLVCDTYEYDVHNNVISWKRDDKKNNLFFVQKYAYEYNMNANAEKEGKYDEDGNIYWYRAYEYDVNGNKTEEWHYDESGNIDENWTYGYDDSGHEIERECYDKSGTLICYQRLEYDTDNNLIKSENYSIFREEISYVQIIYEYDVNGNKVRKENYDRFGNMTSYTVYEYYEEDDISNLDSLDSETSTPSVSDSASGTDIYSDENGNAEGRLGDIMHTCFLTTR